MYTVGKIGRSIFEGYFSYKTIIDEEKTTVPGNACG